MSTTCAVPHKETENKTCVATKAAILVLSDPNSGSDEALGRVFNALAAAYEFKQQGDEVTVRFQPNARWILLCKSTVVA